MFLVVSTDHLWAGAVLLTLSRLNYHVLSTIESNAAKLRQSTQQCINEGVRFVHLQYSYIFEPYFLTTCDDHGQGTRVQEVASSTYSCRVSIAQLLGEEGILILSTKPKG